MTVPLHCESNENIGVSCARAGYRYSCMHFHGHRRKSFVSYIYCSVEIKQRLKLWFKRLMWAQLSQKASHDVLEHRRSRCFRVMFIQLLLKTCGGFSPIYTFHQFLFVWHSTSILTLMACVCGSYWKFGWFSKHIAVLSSGHGFTSCSFMRVVCSAGSCLWLHGITSLRREPRRFSHTSSNEMIVSCGLVANVIWQCWWADGVSFSVNVSAEKHH